jgi:hypothetical protein
MKKETDRSFYVSRDRFDWDSLRSKIMDSAGELAFWGTEAVFIMEMHPQAYRSNGVLMHSISVSKVNGEPVISEDGSDLDAIVDKVINNLIGEKAAWVVKFCPDYQNGYFMPSNPIYHANFKRDPNSPICLLGWNVDVSRYAK